ncbi:DsbA family protein [Prosthecomicrobium sp. N25]|uniref:DsbA family protein n=1 Tax=Prosthecomicrobium sp. N25 TaxID=3129254 RepID=UPI00307873DB
MALTRRRFLTTTAVAAVAVGLLGTSAFDAFAQQAVDMAELMKPGPLGEKALGKEDAPVTVIEYASMTCGHCAAFHKSVYPYLKSTYIDTGKVRLILREFPLDPLAAAVFMLARCAPEDKYFDMVSLFFEQQTAWTRTDQPVDALFNLSKQVGFTQDSFKQCLTNQSLLDGVNAVKDRGADKFKVNATPTFFVNGQRAKDFQSIEGVDKTLAPFLKG